MRTCINPRYRETPVADDPSLRVRKHSRPTVEDAIDDLDGYLKPLGQDGAQNWLPFRYQPVQLHREASLEEAERGKNLDDAASDSIDIECGELRHNCVDSSGRVSAASRISGRWRLLRLFGLEACLLDCLLELGLRYLRVLIHNCGGSPVHVEIHVLDAFGLRQRLFNDHRAG